MVVRTQIQVVNAREALSDAKHDASVAIHVAPLISPDFGMSQPMYYTACVEQQIQAHVHQHGDEFYYVVSGRGRLYVSTANFDGTTARPTTWDSLEVQTGDVFIIPQRVAHSLQNRGDQPLTLHFMCSPDHMRDIGDGGDRWIVSNPPHYVQN